MVHRVAGGAVDDGRIRDVLSIVDHDRPDVDKGEEGDVREFLEREKEGEDVVGEGLREAVYGVEGMRCVGSWHYPFVVRFVEGLVELWVVQAPVDPVDEEVGEDNKEGELQIVVCGKRGLTGCVVEFGVAADFGREEGGGQDGHDGHGDVGLFHLKANLVLEEFGVVDCRFVEDEDVGYCGADEVDEEAKEPGYEEEGCGLAEHVIAGPGAAISPGRGLQGDCLGGGRVEPFVLGCLEQARERRGIVPGCEAEGCV